MFTGGVAGVLGCLLPRGMLAFHKRKRAVTFNEQLVSALAILTNALRTGFSLPKAFQLIAADMPKPICQSSGS